MYRLYLLFLLAATAALAQPPPGGYVPKRVQHLARVAEPPGGLFPYRMGRLWGYADTTGRVVIKPVFGREPMPFALGVGMVVSEQDSLTLINARGELLRASARHAIGFAAGGGFELISRRGVGFRPALAEFRYPAGQVEAVTDTLWLSPSNNAYDVRLSPTRGLRIKESRLSGGLAGLYGEHDRGALIDERGKPLTKYKYSLIEPYRDGFARAKLTGPSAGMALLNRRGQEVVVARHGGLVGPYSNRVLVSRPTYDAASGERRSHKEIVDTTGHVLQTYPPGTSVEIRRLGSREVLIVTPSNEPLRMYDVNGQELLPGQELAAVYGDWNNRIWVHTMAGKQGLLNQQLQWVASAQYDKLYYSDGEREIRALPRQPDIIRFDTAYAVVKQHGQYGMVSVHTGQVVIPIRYDAIRKPLLHGFASLVREGKTYVVNAQGQELAEGVMPYGPEYHDGTWMATVKGNYQGTVITAQGQLLCPWVSTRKGEGTNSCHPPTYGHHGLIIVQDCNSSKPGEFANLIDLDGKPQLPWKYERIFARPGFYVMSLPNRGTLPDKLLFDEHLQPLSQTLSNEWRWLPGEWMSNGDEIYHSSGKHLTVPIPLTQTFDLGTRVLPDAPFAKGVWRLTQYVRNQPNNPAAGYITLGGRQLWEE